MDNVFQFGNYAIAKMFLFGWCLEFNGDGMWYALREVDDIRILEACSTQLYPAYVPAEFQQAVKAELSRRVTAEAVRKATTAKAVAVEPPVQPATAVNNANDTVALLTQLLNAAPVGTVFELPYLRLEVTAGEWLLAATTGDRKVEALSRVRYTIADVIGRIKARWW